MDQYRRASGSNFLACVPLKYHPCLTRPTLTDLNPDDYNKGLRYYPLMVNLDTYNGICNTLDDLSGRISVPNKAEHVNLNMITRINETKTLTKHISCECKCIFDGRKCNSNQKWNNNKC